MYVPAQEGRERIEFLILISNYIRGNLEVILLGDFNLVFNSKLDRNSKGWIHSKKGAEVLEEIINSANLADVYREKNPLGRLYTWHQTGGLAATRIDRVYVSKEIMRDCGQIAVLSNDYSDHGMLVMDFNFRNSIRGKSYWKANVSVFKD